MAPHNSTLDTIFRNIGEVADDDQFRAIVDALDAHHPHVAGFVEVRVPRRRLRTIPGYRIRQSLHGEGRHVVMLVRRDCRLPRSWVRRMKKRWVGPHQLNPKAPRVFQGGVVETPDGQQWDVDIEHWVSGGPTGGVLTKGRNRPAWLENAARATRQTRRRAARYAARLAQARRNGKAAPAPRPQVRLADFNAEAHELAPYAARMGAELVEGAHVDHALAVNAAGVGKRLSRDRPHPLMGFTFRSTIPLAAR